MRHETARSPLAHPLWLLALAMLLLNDHVLKAQPALAGVLTGKLSDFAGLVVAPPLLVVITRARSTWARRACIALVGIGFFAIKVSPPCARALEQLLGAIGVPSRIWVDPTDLVALPSLWLAQRVLDQAEPASRWLVRASLVTGLLACVATTSGHGEPRPALVNRRHAPLKVQVADGPILDCDGFDPTMADMFGRADFRAPRQLQLAAQTWEFLGPECGVVWLTIGDEFDGVVAWNDLGHEIYDYEPIDQKLLDVAVTVEGNRDELRVTVGKKLDSFFAPPPLDEE